MPEKLESKSNSSNQAFIKDIAVLKFSTVIVNVQIKAYDHWLYLRSDILSEVA